MKHLLDKICSDEFFFEKFLPYFLVFCEIAIIGVFSYLIMSLGKAFL